MEENLLNCLSEFAKELEKTRIILLKSIGALEYDIDKINENRSALCFFPNKKGEEQKKWEKK